MLNGAAGGKKKNSVSAIKACTLQIVIGLGLGLLGLSFKKVVFYELGLESELLLQVLWKIKAATLKVSPAKKGLWVD